MKVTYLNYLDFAQQTINYQQATQQQTTNYLRDNCGFQIPLSENTGKKKRLSYVKVPRHVSDEILKLHILGFKGKLLVIEKAKTPPKAKHINGVNQNIFPQTQISQTLILKIP